MSVKNRNPYIPGSKRHIDPLRVTAVRKTLHTCAFRANANLKTGLNQLPA